MDKDVKITLSLFLTWLVFGLFNLFGQPQAFVPPIIIDGLMVVGLGIYFWFPIQKNIFYPSLLIFPLFIFLLSSMELGWLQITETHLRITLLIALLFSLFLLIASIKYFQFNQRVALIGGMVSLIFAASFLYALIPEILIQSLHPIIIYGLGGVLSFLGIFLIQNNNTESKTFRRILLVLFLNFTFDIGNYLALLALS